MRLASGSDSIADHSPATLESLKQKHPNRHPDCCFGPAPDPDLFSVTITEEDVKRGWRCETHCSRLYTAQIASKVC